MSNLSKHSNRSPKLKILQNSSCKNILRLSSEPSKLHNRNLTNFSQLFLVHVSKHVPALLIGVRRSASDRARLPFASAGIGGRGGRVWAIQGWGFLRSVNRLRSKGRPDS